ncbi:MAG TPA: hypothetical protein VG323_12605 [Thermoanaerobaculia bacterium]|nr:hypothetical protein [Thermoanaerobaculia bacterium]
MLLGGRALIAVGVAYLLRALAEAKVFPLAVAVTLGFAYSAVWLWRSLWHAHASRRAHAAFAAAIAAVIAYPILWESTVRFHLLGVRGAAIGIAIVTTLLVVIGYRGGGERIAWIGAAGAISCTVGLAAETRELAAPMLSLAAGGAATWWCAVRRKWRYAPLPLAIEFNLLAFALVGLTLLEKAADPRGTAAAALVIGFVIYAGAIVTRPLVRHDDVGAIDALHVGIAALPALVGAPLVAGIGSPLAVAIAFTAGIAGALSYAAMLRTSTMTVAPYFFGVLGMLGLLVATANLLAASAAAALWGIAAGAAAVLARRAIPQLWGHAAVYALASSIAAGLFAASLGVVSGLGKHPLNLSIANVLATLGIATAAGVAVASGAQPWRIARLVLAAIATLLALGAVAAAVVPISHNDAAAAAALRSVIIAAAAVAITLAARSPRVRELATLVTPLLILGATKFLFDDFGSGRAASLFITLATYGVALVLIARLRARPATIT